MHFALLFHELAVSWSIITLSMSSSKYRHSFLWRKRNTDYFSESNIGWNSPMLPKSQTQIFAFYLMLSVLVIDCENYNSLFQNTPREKWTSGSGLALNDWKIKGILRQRREAYRRLLIGIRHSCFQIDISPCLSEVSNFSCRFRSKDIIWSV